MLNENRTDRTTIETSKPVSLHPCDQCTKNFLTAESLTSHQQRKHSTVEGSHEMSDDNCEKCDIGKNEGEKSHESEDGEEKSTSEPNILQSNDNKVNESNTKCDACSERKKVSSSNVAVQCDVTITESPATLHVNDGK